MRKRLPEYFLLICICAVSVPGGELRAEEANGGWPFISMRSYGTLKANERFTRRLLAAAERHPGLIEEVWSGGLNPLRTPEENRARLEADAELRAECRKRGIAVGFQFLTVGHGCDGRRPGFSDAAWIVNEKGELKPGILCMTSPEALEANRKFTEELIRAANPSSLWPDDDLRLQKEYTAGAHVCFCDRCLKLFAAESGCRLGRKELAERLFDTRDVSEESQRIRKAWADFNEHAVVGMAAQYRLAIENTKSDCRLGLQICDAASRYEGDNHPMPIIRALSGKDGKSVGLRPGGGLYSDFGETPFWKLIYNVLPENMRAATNSCIASLCYEAENWPHISAMKTPGAQMLECSLMLAAGCNSLALYYGADQNMESEADYDFYFDTVAKWKPFFLAIRDTFAGTQPAGIAAFVGTRYGHHWQGSFTGEMIRMLENSVPVTAEAGAVEMYLITSWNSDLVAEADLKRLLSKPVLMDAAAYAELGKRFPGLEFTRKLEISKFGAFDWGGGVGTGYEQFADGSTAADVECVMKVRTSGARLSESGYNPLGQQIACCELLTRLTTDKTGKAGCMAKISTGFGGTAIVIQSFNLGGHQNPWTHYRRKAILDAIDDVVSGRMSVRILEGAGNVQLFPHVDASGRTVGVYLLNWQHGETRPFKLAVRRPAKKSWKTVSVTGEIPCTVADGAQDEHFISLPSMPPASAWLVM